MLSPLALKAESFSRDAIELACRRAWLRRIKTDGPPAPRAFRAAGAAVPSA
jgi:hypothetical protein